MQKPSETPENWRDNAARDPVCNEQPCSASDVSEAEAAKETLPSEDVLMKDVDPAPAIDGSVMGEAEPQAAAPCDPTTVAASGSPKGEPSPERLEPREGPSAQAAGAAQGANEIPRDRSRSPRPAPAILSQEQRIGLPQGFTHFTKVRNGSLKPYLIFEAKCACGESRAIDRRQRMDEFLVRHRPHNPAWASVTSDSFPWCVGGVKGRRPRAASAARFRPLGPPPDLGPLWKRARSGEVRLLSSPSLWRCVALRAVKHHRQSLKGEPDDDSGHSAGADGALSSGDAALLEPPASGTSSDGGGAAPSGGEGACADPPDEAATAAGLPA
uniref:Uncharacterized protein n=1 Tax=Tetraselmis sp. GSL018 TaxID=582737 RepID=A0A061QW10_9CHLO|mmetsp:Transcript_18254/g.43661  ORF Transcript_18254/g.43661 Transcript_18254/m.43661 type:complete len:327 (-) Transcript_18254:138-1118(-)|eukprot:CAMPEP_0177606500 /NCGR_PEP_ID=MMETSP0419_2-20121207/17341_1 /TAXON_ID=582737 /ORGANISM="Tetraselmis sp., Strain GSL018" /LENGTH=326 /DNA_ID=CAMNT_0019100867 /DNA_START=350 /DNA_END=1330 /DNA_ORIENTATION=+